MALKFSSWFYLILDIDVRLCQGSFFVVASFARRKIKTITWKTQNLIAWNSLLSCRDLQGDFRSGGEPKAFVLQLVVYRK